MTSTDLVNHILTLPSPLYSAQETIHSPPLDPRHILCHACLRIADALSGTGARLATGWAGSPLAGRVSHPLDDEQNFMEDSRPPIPIDPQGLVALEYRIRNALKDHGATLPDQKGKRIQNPTARWVFHYFVGIHLLCQAGQWPMVLNLTEEHQHLLRLLGKPYMRFYDVGYS